MTKHPSGRSHLPDFARPPLVEVALSIQFEPIAKLRSVHMGLLWERWRDRFPEVEEHAPLASVLEDFGRPERAGQVKLEVLEELPVARCWFLTASRDQLVQVQRDRLVFNWRKREEASGYPRYPSVRASLDECFADLRRFVEDEGLGEVRPNQCEVTYVNVVEPSGAWSGPGDLAAVLAVFSGVSSDGFLPTPERAQMNLSYIIRGGGVEEPVGRLHVEVQPGIRATDDSPVLRIKLTARGKPLGEGLDGPLAALDLGHEWVVRGFASITTQRFHERWGRNDARSDLSPQR